jgi:GntR family transcriptional regulator
MPSLSERLHEQLRDLIAETVPGERLPSEPALAKELGVSRATLREAMRTFETQGLLLRRQGVGTFVNRPPQIIDSGLEVLDSVNTLAERTGLPVKLGDYHIDSRVASEQEQELFDFKRGAAVIQVTWVVEAESRPVAYLIDILPEEVLSVKELERDFNGSVLDLLLLRGDLALTTSRTEINAVAAGPEVARALGIQRGDVVLRFTATLYTDAGRVIDYSYSYFLPGYFRFHVVRRVGKSGVAK